MRHCQNCNRDYSDQYFRKHCRTNTHLKKTFGVKYIYKKENILVNEIDNTLSDIIEEYKRNFHSFLIVCKSNNKKTIGFPKRVLLKYYDKDEMINVEFNFYSNRKDMSFNYSPSLHQDFYPNLFKCFTNYIPLNIIPKVLNEEDIDIVIDQKVNDKDFRKSDCEMVTFDNKE